MCASLRWIGRSSWCSCSWESPWCTSDYLFRHVYVSACVCASFVHFYVYVCLFICLCLSLCLLSVYLCQCVSVYLSLSLCPYLCLHLFLFVKGAKGADGVAGDRGQKGEAVSGLHGSHMHVSCVYIYSCALCVGWVCVGGGGGGGGGQDEGYMRRWASRSMHLCAQFWISHLLHKFFRKMLTNPTSRLVLGDGEKWSESPDKHGSAWQLCCTIETWQCVLLLVFSPFVLLLVHRDCQEMMELRVMPAQL